MAKTNEGDFSMIKAVIFDMDGTIINTAIEHDFPTWREVFRSYGFTMSYEDFKKASGGKAHDIIKDRVDISDEEVEKFIQKRTQLLSESLKTKGVKLTPGFLKFLKALKKEGFKVALATGAIDSKISVIKEHVALDDYFPTIVTGSEVQIAKPHPQIYLKAAEKLGLSTEDCLAVEDASNGIESAKAAGMKCIALALTHEKEELRDADLIVDSFDQISMEDIKKL